LYLPRGNDWQKLIPFDFDLIQLERDSWREREFSGWESRTFGTSPCSTSRATWDLGFELESVVVERRAPDRIRHILKCRVDQQCCRMSTYNCTTQNVNLEAQCCTTSRQGHRGNLPRVDSGHVYQICTKNAPTVHSPPPTFTGEQPENRVVRPTLLTTVGRRGPMPRCFVGAPLRPYGLP
jgi:hypothetical protein